MKTRRLPPTALANETNASRPSNPSASRRKTYAIKEIYFTLQGEGANTGRAAVFCRFAGCNLWSGREADRASSACPFCDTDFLGVSGPGGGNFSSAETLADSVANCWRRFAAGDSSKFVVCTGGEPLLQLDETAVDAFHHQGFEVAVETNGTRRPPPGVDWMCVSPKANTPCVIRSGNELKLVYPQEGADPADYVSLDFEHFYLQPMDGPERDKNTEKVVEYCRNHPQWKLSLQTHKLIGIR